MIVAAKEVNSKTRFTHTTSYCAGFFGEKVCVKRVFLWTIINMKKYQEALKHLAAAQRLLEELMQEGKESHGNTAKDCYTESAVYSVLKKSHKPLSARGVGQNCRPFRRMTLASKTEMLEKMVADGLIGSKKTPQTVKYFAIKGDHQ